MTGSIPYMILELEKIGFIQASQTEGPEENDNERDGMEVMCPRCRSKATSRTPKMCRRCGERMKPADEVESNDLEYSDEEDEGESLTPESNEERMGKNAGIRSSFVGGTSMGLSTVAGLKAHKAMNESERAKALKAARRSMMSPRGYVKQAGVSHVRGSRFASLNLRTRGMRHDDVASGLRRLRARQKVREAGRALGGSNVD